MAVGARCVLCDGLFYPGPGALEAWGHQCGHCVAASIELQLLGALTGQPRKRALRAADVREREPADLDERRRPLWRDITGPYWRTGTQE
jgi:hypothetical protein